MSKYTTEVRYLCEVYADLDHSVGYNSIDTILTQAIPKIFDFPFPIFDENYRNVLEKKILKHYYTREISEETFGLWKLRLDTKLNEIMPYYNKLYNSELIEFNPLYTVNLTRDKNTDRDSTRTGKENITDHTTTTDSKEYSEERQNENDGTLNGRTSSTVASEVVTDGESTNSNSSTTTTNMTKSTSSQTSTTSQGTSSDTKRELYSDTPQGALTGIENETYLTNAKKSTDSGSTSGSTSGTGSETVTDSGTVGVSASGSGTNDETVTTSGTESGTRNDATHNEGSENVSGSEETNGSVSYTRSRGDSDVVNSTEDYLEHVVGYEGATGSKMLKDYRDTFLNIDMMVINELEPLFFQLW